MPASAAAIPPWIAQPADPAAHYVQGYQIGVHVGAQQAAQAFQAQQQALAERRQLMAEQQQEYEDQMNQQVMNLKAAETARKFQANQMFRARVASGEDPTRVLMELAPDLGESPTSVLHTQAMRDQAQANLQMRQQTQQRLANQFSIQERDRQLRAQQPTAGVRESTQLAEWKSQIEKETDPQKKQFLQNQIDSMEARHGMAETSITSSPGGGTEVRITKGGQKQPGALTPTEQTKLGEDVQATANSLRVLNPLQDKVDSGAVGILPTIGNVVFDEVLSQFGPDLVDKHRVSARQNIGIATQQVLGELNNRGRFSNMELSAIKEMMPGLGLRESPGAAQEKLSQLRKMLAEKGANATEKLGRQIQPEVVRALAGIFTDDQDLLKEYQSGAIGNKTFWAVYNFRHPKGK